MLANETWVSSALLALFTFFVGLVAHILLNVKKDYALVVLETVSVLVSQQGLWDVSLHNFRYNCRRNFCLIFFFQSDQVSRRISIFTALMFGWVFMAIFSARLSSSLSVPMAERINGIEDLYDKGKSCKFS